MDAVGDVSGIEMKISTNCPGVQMYTANFVENVKGKKTTFTMLEKLFVLNHSIIPMPLIMITL